MRRILKKPAVCLCVSARGPAVLLLACLSLAGGAAYAVEFEVLDKFSVDGYSEFKGSAVVSSGLFTVGASTLVVKNGNVGIGVAAPVYKLAIDGAIATYSGATLMSILDTSGKLYGAGVSNLYSANNADLATAVTGVTISRNISDANSALIVKQTHASSTGDILQVKNSASTVLTVQQGGNVGIGTAAPVLGRLVVNNITDFTNTFFQVGANSGGSAEGVIVNDDRGFAGVNSGRSFVVRTRDDGANDTGAIADFRTVGGTDASRFYVGISGNVGIGTAGPGAKLDVAGDIKASGGGTFYLTNDNFLRMTSWMNCVARAAIAGKVVALITWPKAGQTVSCNSLCATAVGPNSTTGYTCIGGGYFGYSPTQNTSTQGSIGERISWGACETSFGPASSYGYNSSMGRYMTGEDGTSNGHVCCCGGAGE